MKLSSKTPTILVVIYLLFVVFMFTGWVKSVYKLTQCDFEPSYKAEILYAIGTFSGAGAFLGYFDFGK